MVSFDTARAGRRKRERERGGEEYNDYITKIFLLSNGSGPVEGKLTTYFSFWFLQSSGHNKWVWQANTP